jgi:hypothetical protein
MTNRYYHRQHAVLGVLAVCLGLLFAGRASASDYLFGFSSYDGDETLTVDVAGGGAPVVLSTDGNQGWWSATYPNSPGNTNYFAGSLTSGGTTAYLRDFFSFALSSLAGDTVTAATLSLGQFWSVSDSGNASEQYTLYGVSLPATVLDDTGGTSAAIYNALAAGSPYGSFSVPVTGFGFDSDSFTLNAAGIAALNAAIAGSADSFSIGGSLASPAAIPEPTSLLSISASLFGLAFARRRRAA